MSEIDAFLQNWGEDSQEVRELFHRLYSLLRDCPLLTLRWKAEPGVVYSLRGALKEARTDDLSGDIVRIDVVDDDPEERWLSIRLTAALGDAPGETWETLPGALSGRAAFCLDVDECDDETTATLPELFRKRLAKLPAPAE